MSCDRDIGHDDCSEVSAVNFLESLETFDEGELRDVEEGCECDLAVCQEVLERCEIDDLDSADCEDERYDVACSDSDYKRDELSHLLAVDGAKNDCEQGYETADESCIV